MENNENTNWLHDKEKLSIRKFEQDNSRNNILDNVIKWQICVRLVALSSRCWGDTICLQEMKQS